MRCLRFHVPALLMVGWLAAFAVGEDYLPAQALQEANLRRQWQLQLPLDPNESVADAYLVDDQVYLGTDSGYCYAVDAQTGAIRWLQPITRAGSGYPLARPAHNGDQTIFVTPVDLQVYGRRTGQPISRTNLRYPPGSGVCTAGHLLFVGGLDQRLYAMDDETHWYAWRTYLDGPIVSTPVVHEGILFVATQGRSVFACRARDRRFRWQAFTMGPVSADLVVDDRGVFVASTDQALYLMDLNYGETRWVARFGSPLREAPLVTEKLVYQYCEAEGVVALETGLPYEVKERKRWSVPNGRQALTADAEFAYIRTADELLRVRQDSGEIAQRVPIGGFDMGLPSAKSTSVLLVASDGRVFCAEPLDAKPVQQEDVLRALAGGAPTTQPAEAPASAPGEQTAPPAAPERDPLQAGRTSRPIGGKSKISRGWGEKPE